LGFELQLGAHQIALISGGSALFGGLLVATITGLFSLRSKRNEYVNDYYKTVIQRRIAAYEQLESLIVAFKTSVFDENDKKLYHLPFSENNQTERALIQLGSAMSQGLWISDESFSKVSDLNRLLFRMPDAQSEAITFGKEHYQEIAELRDALEIILAADMLEMHKVEQFLTRKKKRKWGFTELYPRGTDGPS
jgi:hypothetical protein